MAVARGYVQFAAEEIGRSVTILLGNGPCQITGGIGGWQEEERAGHSPATVWTKTSSIRQTIPVTFDDGYGGGVEARVASLWRLGRPRGRFVRPPILRVAGLGVHRPDLPWVMEALEPADDVKREGAGAVLTRQSYVVTLLHFTPATVLVKRSPAKANRDVYGDREGSKRMLYTVKVGDTLARIAARKDVYGDASKWKRIAKANGIRDPRSKRDLKDGRKLRIPR